MLGVSVSESAATVDSEHDTTDAPVGLVLVSQKTDISCSPLALMPSTSAPPCSPTTRVVYLDNEICQLRFFSSHLIAWSYFLLFLVF